MTTRGKQPGACSLAAVVASVLGFAGAAPVQAHGIDGSAIRSHGCQAGIFAFLAADPAVVRTEGQIPARWKLAFDSAGKARLFLDTARCNMTLRGRTRTVVWTELAAQLDSASLPSPERTRSTSNVEGKPNDSYQLTWGADDPELVRWIRTGTGLGDVVRLVPGLTLQLSGGAVRNFIPGRMIGGGELDEHYSDWTFRKDVPPAVAGGVARQCSSRRRFRIRLPATWRSATARLGNRPLRVTRRGGRLTAIVDLRGRAAGTVRLRAVGRTATGRRVAQTRTYRLCAKRRHRPSRPPASPPPPSRSDIWTQCAHYARQGVNPDACADGVEAAMVASAKYHDVNQAIADGFVKLTDCESSPLGGMGEHWGRLDRMVDPTLDVRAPEMLLYLNTPHGRDLLGFEYEQTATFGGLPAWGPTHPDTPVSARPSMLGGKVFDGPMAGHTAIQPWHYDLHVYEWVKNPAGLFEPWNPAVKC